MNDHVIEVRNLTRVFGNTVALDDVSLTAAQGVVFGLVGENGAGKTTLIKHLLGLLKAQRGSVSVFGLDPVQAPAAAFWRARSAHSPWRGAPVSCQRRRSCCPPAPGWAFVRSICWRPRGTRGRTRGAKPGRRTIARCATKAGWGFFTG
jgi:energy-coupling factor transporter ATP-binding protein EcfA2